MHFLRSTLYIKKMADNNTLYMIAAGAIAVGIGYMIYQNYMAADVTAAVGGNSKASSANANSKSSDYRAANVPGFKED